MHIFNTGSLMPLFLPTFLCCSGPHEALLHHQLCILILRIPSFHLVCCIRLMGDPISAKSMLGSLMAQYFWLIDCWIISRYLMLMEGRSPIIFISFISDGTSVLSYSLLLLSVDLYSPHVKNKMSKREFIRNNRQIVMDANRDLLGDLYDDVYLNGITAAPLNVNGKLRQPFRPYGVLFELKTWNVQSCC